MNLNLKIYFVVVFAISVLAIAAFFYFSQTKKISKVCVNNNCFEVELAENILQQSRGLMFRESLQEHKGMFFIFKKEDIYPFWMENTKISLDIIWINSENKIVFISKSAEPCKTLSCPKIIPLEKAKYVLEINGGLVEKFGIKVGDEVNY